MGEQRGEVGIVQLVVDDEADIDRKPGAIIVDAHSMAVATGPELAVVDGDRIMFRQGSGGGIAADSRPDREPHFSPSIARGEIGGLFPEFQIGHRCRFDLSWRRIRASEQEKNSRKTPEKAHEIFVRFRLPHGVPTSRKPYKTR